MNNLEETWNHFSSEVTAASWAFFVWKGINDIASNDQQIYSAINGNALTWNVILHSLQNTFLITLGRLFDGDDDTFSVDKFLCFCIGNIDQFNEASLRKRKIAANGGAVPRWLDEYMKDTCEPSAEDFQRLRGAVTKRRKLYEKTYRPIRNKVIAHKEIATINNVGELFSKTNIGQIQDFLWVLYQIEQVIFHLLHNGRLTPVGHYKFNEEQRVIEDAKSLLEKLKI